MVERATIFGSEAAAYDRLRPRYPPDVIGMVVEGSPELVVDAGCGTGIAARQVADRGCRVLGVELDPKMAAVARGHGIEVSVSALESWEPVACDVMYAAQSWHWIDPDRGAEMAAAALRPDGRWMAFWNHEIDEDIDRVCNPVYERIAPSLISDRAARDAGSQQFTEGIAAGLRATGCFGSMTRRTVDWIDQVSGELFVDRLGSHSGHRLLADDEQARVRTALLDAIGRDRRLSVRYETEVFLATRRA